MPNLIDVEVKPSGFFKGNIDVSPVWADVDRPKSSTWGVPERLVPRFVKAIRAGVVFTNPHVLTDVKGQTYVEHDVTVSLRTLNADLKRLGF